jgi:hypothetical protein
MSVPVNGANRKCIGAAPFKTDRCQKRVGEGTVGSRGPKGLSGGDEDVSQRPLTLMHLKLDTSEEPPPTAVGNTRQPRGQD